MSGQGFLNSANSVIQLLKEKDHNLNILGLQKLLPLVDTHWHEISEHLNLIEEFYESEKFAQRNLAAFIASKIYFNLEEHQEALDLAIKSGEYFKLHEKTQFTEQLINTCITIYIQNSQHNYESSAGEQIEISQDYKKIVDYMFEQSLKNRQFKHVVGIAVESRRIDVISESLKQDADINANNTEILQYLFEIAMSIVTNRKLEVLKLITEFYKQKQLSTQDYINQCLCYFYIDDYESVANILNNLITENEDLDQDKQNLLTAFQIANEISENENQYFINRIISAFPIETNNETMTQRREKLVKILTGEVRKKMNKIFLQQKDFSDPQLMLNLKQVTEAKQSIALGGCLLANGIFNAGTNNQQFMDKHFDWIKSATFWNKFSTIATLGVINKGNQKHFKQIFADFIPGSTSNLGQGDNPNANGGSLYGMGLMHEGSKNQEVIDYLIEQIKHPEYSQNETIVHGAALGLGLVGLASEDENIYAQLQAILNTSQSISGEAAGIGMGLIMAGSGNELAIEELVNFAQETDRDKIVRAISLGLSMIVFGKEQAADTLIEQLASDKEGNIRYGACMALGMAYVGSGNQKAIRRLLNFAVTDVSDDVRRQAVISLAFVMFRQPEEYLKMVKLLSISYSPHVRYGTAIGIGIACAGTGNGEAYEILEPLFTDTTPWVKQAAYIGGGMLFQLSNNNSEPKLEKFSKMLEESFSRKYEDPIVKLGAQLATSILKSGGQNQLIKLGSHSGFPRLGACVGMMAFTHFWHWYPLVNFLSLSFEPSAIIGVNENFRIPKSFEFKSNVKPTYTDYIPHIQKDQDKKDTKQQTVNLSTTNRAKARAQMKDTLKDASKIDKSSLRQMASKLKSDSRREELKKIEVQKQEQQMEIEEQHKKEEVLHSIYSNPSRVLEKYKKHISFIDGRYTPIIKERKSGIIFLLDSSPEQEEEFIGEDQFVEKPQEKQQEVQQQQQQGDDEGPDVEPPEDFIFDMNEQNK